MGIHQDSYAATPATAVPGAIDSLLCPRRLWGWQHLGYLLLVLAVVILAGVHLQQFYARAEGLWNGAVHDRTQHYLFTLKLRNALAQGNIGTLIAALWKARLYPPLHGILSALPMCFGVDYRLAVLPSILGWMLTVVGGFALARQMTPKDTGRLGAWAAGLTAAGFLLASPAHNAYSTDIMLEALGAGLSMLVLWLYMRALERPGDRRAWTFLALALTLLFLEKLNYWLLVVLAMGMDMVLAHAGKLWIARVELPRVVRKWLGRNPLGWVVLGAWAAAAGAG
ncbi:MAG: hypothetical protein WCI73_11845, partial [Phycisphaerae bacterium]